MRKEKKFNILLGKDRYGDYVFLDDAFKYSDGMQGLCWTRMRFHTEEEYERDKQNMIDDWYLKEIRQDAVRNDRTEQSYQDWCEDALYESDSFVYDDSYRYQSRLEEWLEIINKKEWTDYTIDYSDCSWGWRMFDKSMLNKDNWEWVYTKNFNKFVKLYEKYEKPNDDRNTITKARKRLQTLYEVWLFTTEIAKMYNEEINNPEYAEQWLLKWWEISHDKYLSFDEGNNG